MPHLVFRPAAASNFAHQSDAIFYVITALTVFFTIGVIAAIILLAVNYRHGRKADRSNAKDGHLPLELTWTILPTIAAVIVFAWGADIFVKERTPPKDATEVFVVGKQWMWHIQHSNGVRENNELHVPLGQPVKLTMISQDVIHAFYLPDFRVQYMVVPGRYTSLWFIPTEVGKFHLFCNMYCGTQHSEMGGFVYVMKPSDYEAWLNNDGNDVNPTKQSMAERGETIFKAQACANCHVGQDTPQAPTLVGIFGKRRDFVDGGNTVADDAYVRESILNPYEHILKGYEKTMPSNYKLTESQILDLIAYIQSLSASPKTALAAQPANSTKGGTR